MKVFTALVTPSTGFGDLYHSALRRSARPCLQGYWPSVIWTRKQSVHGPRRFALRNRRTRDRRDAADSRFAGRKLRSRDKELITLSRSRTTGHASTRKGIAVGIRSRETVRECLQECHDVVLFLIRQAE